MADRTSHRAANPAAAISFPSGAWDCVMESLSLPLQQRRVVEALLRGRGDKQIAVELGVAFSTVRTHLARIFARLHVSDRCELLLFLMSKSQALQLEKQ